jgi:hypothetical protein
MNAFRIQSAFLVLAILGCGRQAEPTASVTVTAPTAPTVTAKAAPADPKPAAPSVPVLKDPATLAQATAIIDLKTLPRLPGARVQIARPQELMYSAPGAFADAESLYRTKFAELGWTLDATPVPGVDPKEYFFGPFDKAGFRVSVSASKSRMKEGFVDVHITSHGNVDARAIARMTDAKPAYNHWNYASYKTDAKPADVLAFYRKELPAKGWREYRVSLAAAHAKEDRHLLGFAQNGIQLFFNIKGDKSAPTNVECMVSLKDRPPAVPLDKLPAAATFAEGKKIIDLNRFPRIDKSTAGKGSSANLTVIPPGSVDGAVAFYRAKLAEAGWTEDDASSQYDGEAHLYFTKAGYLLGCLIRKDFQGPQTIVKIENFGNVTARDLPRLEDASERTQGSPGDDDYETETPIAKAADFYRKELPPHGWKELENKTEPDGSRRLEFSWNAIFLTIEIGVGRVRVRSHLIGEVIPRPGSELGTLQIVDLRHWSRFKKSAAKHVDSASLEYVAAGTAQEVEAFHRDQLVKDRWRPLVSRKDALRFDKDGFVIELRILPEKDGKCDVLAVSRGDVDLKRMIAPEDTKLDPDSVLEDARFTTALAPDAVKAFYRTELPAFGWTPIDEKDAFAPTIRRILGDAATGSVFEQRLVRIMVDVGTVVDGRTPVRLRSWGVATKMP